MISDNQKANHLCFMCIHEPKWVQWEDGMPQHEGVCLARADRPKLLALPGRIDRSYKILIHTGKTPHEWEGMENCQAFAKCGTSAGGVNCGKG